MATTKFKVQKSSTGIVETGAGRAAAENPLAGAVRYTLEKGPQMVKVANGEEAHQVMLLLRRDVASDNEYGVRIQYQDDSGNVVAEKDAKQVHFVAKKKSARAYTAADIREWSAANGRPIAKGKKIPTSVREAFKKAWNGEADDAVADESAEETTGENTGENAETTHAA